MSILTQSKNRLQTVSWTMAFTESGLIRLSAVATALVLVYHLFYLTKYPLAFGDESWFSNATWNWLQTGVNFETMFTGVLDQFGHEWVQRPFIGEAPWLLSFALLGLGLFQARLVSWLFGLVLLLLVVGVGRRSYSLLTGSLAALFLSLSPPFLLSSHYARQDIMVAVVVMAAYLLAVKALQEDKWWAHLLAGLLLGLSPDIHLNGGLFIIPLAALYLMTYRFSILKKRGTWLVALGGVIGIAYFVGLHILPGPAYFTLNKFNFVLPENKAPLQTLNLGHLWAAIRGEISIYHFYEHNLDFALIGAGLVSLLLRRSEADRYLLTFVGVSFATIVLLRGRSEDYYAILLYPFFMLIVAEAVVSLARSSQGSRAQQAFVILLVLLFIGKGLVHTMRPGFNNNLYNYNAATNQIKSVVPAEARIMGLPTWWLGLAEYDYRASLSLNYYNFFNGYNLEEGLKAIRPDFIIIDKTQRDILSADAIYPVPWWGLPGQEFEAFLARQGEQVLIFSDPWHGEVEVYAIHWD